MFPDIFLKVDHASKQFVNMAKRLDYTSWDELFMGTASFISQRSKDPVRQVGAAIVNNEKKIIACGYNGMPPGIDDNDGVWGKDPDEPLLNKKFLVCHAEANALANTTEKVNGCTIYVTHFPCNDCAKLLSIHGIKHVVYANDYGVKDNIDLRRISMRIFDAAGITIKQYDGRGSFGINVFE
jgi:dCMP deaminase